MGEKEAFDALQQAESDVTSHPERPVCHESAMRIYLAGFAYVQSHPRPSARLERPEPETERPEPQ